MKISYNWLKNYINIDMPAEQVAELLTDTGLEVEKIDVVESIKGGLKGVVIGEVLTKTQHTNADRLAITTVDIGLDKPLQIVCGAPNVAAGQKVPVATVGTRLYEGEESFKIKRSKIRGEVSEGMICGADEIGLGEKTDGIMVLENNAQVGTLASEYFDIDSDIVFEIGLTPNRSDAMGHIGVARDLIAALNYKGNNLKICKPSVEEFRVNKETKSIDVKVEDYMLCPRYSSLSIKGVKVQESPVWLKNQLTAIGLKPINNIVDITNYVMHETGQPLHAFDIAKIKGDKVVVSTVKDKTKFITLDEQKIELSSDDLMINNTVKPMCIAGVYGGIESGVSVSTTDVFLESAYFNPISIRGTSKRHGLNTDASFRYERGCDPNITVYALKRAALLISEICNTDAISHINDIYPEPIHHFPVNLSYEKIDKVIGQSIERKKIQSILQDLEIDIKTISDNGLELLVPPFRADVTREIDVIEEILRIYGFNTVKESLSFNMNLTSSKGINSILIKNIISDLLSSNGFVETMNNSLIKQDYTSLITELDEKQNVELLNPLSKDLNTMRQSLLFGGLKNIEYNQNRKQVDLKLYEFGKTYHKNQKEYIEKEHLQLLVSGNLTQENWNSKIEKANFFFIKEKVEHILNRLGVKNITSKESVGWGRSYSLTYSYNNERLVCFGEVQKELCAHFNINSDVYMADFNWDLLLELAGVSKMKYKEVSKFPEVRRDLSLLIDQSISFDNINKIARKVDSKILKSVKLFDVYEGDKLPKGKKSYAIACIMSDNTQTLTDKKIDNLMNNLIKSLQENLGAELRE